MPNVASVLKQEISRLARKEARAQLGPLKKALAAERRASAAFKRELAEQKRTLARLNGALKRQAKSGGGPGEVQPVEAADGKWRKDTVRSTRRKLALTQAQLAKLIGVNPVTVSFWETGRSTPRARQQASVLGARGLSREQAHARLGPRPRRRKKKTARARKA